jgi:hypothetical protein
LPLDEAQVTVITYSEHEYWSIIHGENVARVSVPDEQGREYWTIVPTGGSGYRKRREAAIEMCLEAMRRGLQPGEVRTRTC